MKAMEISAADSVEMRIRSELEPGEVLLWHGQPKRGLYLRPNDAIFIPASLVWGGVFAFIVLSEGVSQRRVFKFGGMRHFLGLRGYPPLISIRY
jgi:hypothetical protein